MTARNCPACGGDDGEAPCAYPGEAKRGCLRDRRLRQEMNDRLKAVSTRELRERIRQRAKESR